jgi:hypothetical protein
MLLWAAFFALAVVAVEHSLLAAATFVLLFGLAATADGWVVSDSIGVGILAEVGTAILIAIALSFAPRGRRS